MSVVWSDSYKIGDSAIDAQHAELFRRTNLFLDASDSASMAEYAIQLYKYTRSHFAHEEELMLGIGYPDYESHKQQHEDLVTRLEVISSGISTMSVKKAEFEEFAVFWLLTHIVKCDTKLSDYIKART